MLASIEDQFKAYCRRNIHHPCASPLIKDEKYYIHCDLCKDDTEMDSKATTIPGSFTFRGHWTRHLGSRTHKRNEQLLARDGSLMDGAEGGGPGIDHQLSQEARSVPELFQYLC